MVPTLAPVLRWTKGPRGTKLYNLQIFRVTQVKKGATPKVTKIYSSFPKGLQMRAPKTRLKAGHLLRLARVAVHRPGVHAQPGRASATSAPPAQGASG